MSVHEANSGAVSLHSGSLQDTAGGNYSICQSGSNDQPRPGRGMKIFSVYWPVSLVKVNKVKRF